MTWAAAVQPQCSRGERTDRLDARDAGAAQIDGYPVRLTMVHGCEHPLLCEFIARPTPSQKSDQRSSATHRGRCST